MPDDLAGALELITEQVAQRLGLPVDWRGLAHPYRLGVSYGAGMVVHHLGGAWQARVETREPPGEGADWQPLADGIRKVYSYCEELDPRLHKIVVGLSSGADIPLSLRLPIPLHKGQWEPGVYYGFGDEVELAGATYRAMRDNPGRPPNEGWQLISARGARGDEGPGGIQGEQGERGPPGEAIIGPRGEKGEKGDRGEPGEKGETGETGPRGIGIKGVEAVPGQPGFFRFMLENGSLTEPIPFSEIRFRGVYEPGERYERGDVVRFSFHLWIATEETEEVPSINAKAWEVFLTGVDPSGTGGGAAGGGPSLPELDLRYVRKIGGDPGGVMTGNLQLRLVGGLLSPALQFANGAGTPFAALQTYVGVGGGDDGELEILARHNGQLTSVAITRADDPPRLELRADPIEPGDAVTRRYVDGLLAPDLGAYVLKAGDTMTGTLIGAIGVPAFVFGDTEFGFTRVSQQIQIAAAGGVPLMAWSRTAPDMPLVQSAANIDMLSAYRVRSLAEPLLPSDAATRAYVDREIAAIPPVDLSGYLPLTGGRLTGELEMGASIVLDAARGVVLQPGPSIIYEEGAALRLRSATLPATLEDASGAASRSPILTQAISDQRYLQLDGGVMRGVINMAGSYRILGLPPTIVDDEAASKAYVDQHLPLDGSRQMTGTLITKDGGGPTSPGIGFGSDRDGFWHAGLMISLSVNGSQIMSWQPGTVTVAARLHCGAGIDMLGSQIDNLLPPNQPAHAATKAYVDDRIPADAPARTFVADPPTMTVPTGGAWQNGWWSGNYDIPRGGESRILISVAINIDHAGLTQTGIIGVRCTGDGSTFVERHNFAFKPGTRSGGISTQFWLDVTGTTVPLRIDLAALDGPGFSTLASGDARSQLLIADMGPR